MSSSSADADRQRLARELHDSVAQPLYAILLYAEASGRALADRDLAPVAAKRQESRETTQEARTTVLKQAHARRVTVQLNVTCDRAERLGGRHEAESSPRAGTRVCVEILR
jgi:signal transduction histidine kinase